MRHQQLIINSKPVQTPLLNFLNGSTEIESGSQNAPPEPEVFAHCDLCADTARGSTTQLDEQGWGLYGELNFCPTHEAMI